MPALPLAYRPPGTTASPDVVSSVLDNGIYGAAARPRHYPTLQLGL